jgi:putative transposase
MHNHTKKRNKWLFAESFSPNGEYIPKNIKLLDKTERWKRCAKIMDLSKQALLRLNWIIYHYEGHTIAQTCRYFGIAPKTFHKWFNRFDEDNIHSLRKLEDQSRAPKHVRQREITPLEEERIVKLRKENMRYGKMKLVKLYQRQYNAPISSWKVQYTIEKYKLYPNKAKKDRINLKTRRTKTKNHKKKRLTELQKLPWHQKRAGYIICLDTVEKRFGNLKRYFFTAIDQYGKVAFARMYQSKNTLNAKDFLTRLYLLMDGNVPRVGHDNGSEFKKYFEKACQDLSIEQYYSRVRTPKDNGVNERFNRTLQEEFIQEGFMSPDPNITNPRLTEWLIKYNYYRPHQSLNYQTPIEFSKVLPMWSSCTYT